MKQNQIIIIGGALLVLSGAGIYGIISKVNNPSTSANTNVYLPPEENVNENITILSVNSRNTNTNANVIKGIQNNTRASTILYLQKQGEASIHIIEYDAFKQASIKNAIIDLPENTSFETSSQSAPYRSRDVQLNDTSQKGVVHLISNNIHAFYSLNVNTKEWRPLFNTEDPVQSWLYDSKKERCLVMTKKGNEHVLRKIQISASENIAEQTNSNASNQEASAPVQSMEDPIVSFKENIYFTEHIQNDTIKLLSFDFDDEKKLYRRTLISLALDNEQSLTRETLLETEEAPIDSPGNLSPNLQYYAYWTKQGLWVKNILSGTTNNLSLEYTTNPSIIWSPQSEKLIFTASGDKTWIYNFSTSKQTQLNAALPGNSFDWISAENIFYFHKNTLRLFSTKNQKNYIVAGQIYSLLQIK